MTEYIEFELLKKCAKTEHYTVVNKKSNDILGWIKWYGAWRQYCFFPLHETIFNTGCMKYIINFIEELMTERKKRS